MSDDKWVKTKDPDAVLDYLWNWADYLGTDTIAAADFAVYDTAGQLLDDSESGYDGVAVDSSSAADTTATVWLSGGEVGTKYVVTCHITSAGGREDDRSLHLTIKEL